MADLNNKIQMTQVEYDELNKKYRHLLDVERPANIDALAAARAQGDLSENADYDAARNEQARIEAEIKSIEAQLDNAVIVESVGDKINVGFIVTYKVCATKELKTIRMVSTIMADPLAEPPAISQESAVGKALLGKKVKDIVTVETVKRKYDIEIVEVSH